MRLTIELEHRDASKAVEDRVRSQYPDLVKDHEVNVDLVSSKTNNQVSAQVTLTPRPEPPLEDGWK